MVDEEMTVDQMKINYNVFDVVAPSLDNNLRPKIQLQDPSECPLKREKRGFCFECDKFKGLISPDGTVFASGVYEGFCDTKNKALTFEEWLAEQTK